MQFIFNPDGGKSADEASARAKSKYAIIGGTVPLRESVENERKWLFCQETMILVRLI
jgi:hypothetical protein